MIIDTFTLEKIRMLDYILANSSLEDVKAIVQQQKTYNILAGTAESEQGPLQSMINHVNYLETQVRDLNEDMKTLTKIINTIVSTPYSYELNMLKQKRSAY